MRINNSWIESIKKMEDHIPSIYRPEFFVCNILNGELYFNPFLEYGLIVSYEGKKPFFSGYSNGLRLLIEIQKIHNNILHSSPAIVYQKIVDLYNQHGVELPYYIENYIYNKKLAGLE